MLVSQSNMKLRCACVLSFLTFQKASVDVNVTHKPRTLAVTNAAAERPALAELVVEETRTWRWAGRKPGSWGADGEPTC